MLTLIGVVMKELIGKVVRALYLNYLNDAQLAGIQKDKHSIWLFLKLQKKHYG